MAECDAPEYLSSGMLVNDKYTQSQLLVESARSDVNDYANNLYSFLDMLAIPVNYYQDINIQVPNPATLPYRPPGHGDVHWPIVTWPTMPTMPNLTDLPNIVLTEPPRNNTEDPGFDL